MIPPTQLNKNSQRLLHWQMVGPCSLTVTRSPLWCAHLGSDLLPFPRPSPDHSYVCCTEPTVCGAGPPWPPSRLCSKDGCQPSHWRHQPLRPSRQRHPKPPPLLPPPTRSARSYSHPSCLRVRLLRSLFASVPPCASQERLVPKKPPQTTLVCACSPRPL